MRGMRKYRFTAVLIATSLLWAVALVNPSQAKVDAPASITSTTNCTPYFTPRVCININGSLLHVDSIRVGVRFPNGYDYYGLYKILKNGVTWKVSPTFGGTGNGDYKWYSWAINANFPDGTVMCGQHTDPFAGSNKPCATIHD